MEHDLFIDSTGSNTDSPYRDDPIDEQSPRSCTHITQVSGTTLKRKRGERGKYRSMTLLKKTLGGRTKLDMKIPYQVLQAIGDNAGDLVNYCGYVVRITNAKNWAVVATSHGDRMWKQVQDAFKLKETNCGDARLHAFVIETMQHLYRYWKHELNAYYIACGEIDQD